MSSFSIECSNVKNSVYQIDKIASVINQQISIIHSINSNLSSIGIGEVSPTLNEIAQRMACRKNTVNNLSEKLGVIVNRYINADETIYSSNPVDIVKLAAEPTDPPVPVPTPTPTPTTRGPVPSDAASILDRMLTDEDYFASLLEKDYDELTEEEIIAMSMYFDQCIECVNGEYVVNTDTLEDLLDSVYVRRTRVVGLHGGSVSYTEATLPPIVDAVIQYRYGDTSNYTNENYVANTLTTDILYAIRMGNQTLEYDPTYEVTLNSDGSYTITTNNSKSPDFTITTCERNLADLDGIDYTWERISSTDSVLNSVLHMPDETNTDVKPLLDYSAEEYRFMCDGAIHVPSNRMWLNQQACLMLADRAILLHGSNGEYEGMSQRRIAKELYAHVAMYYASSWTGNNDFVHSAAVADINLGDGWMFEAAYETIWDLGV